MKEFTSTVGMFTSSAEQVERQDRIMKEECTSFPRLW